MMWHIAMTIGPAMKRAVFACLVIVAGASAMAQTASPKADAEFYVIVDTRTKKCTIVDKKPQVDTANITVATDAIYRTRAEAQAALPTLKPCM